MKLTGSPSGPNLTPAGPCRYDSSLGKRILVYTLVNLSSFNFMESFSKYSIVRV